MDKDQTQPQMTQEEKFQEILENSRKTKRYAAWQLYITIVLVVLPLLALLILLPMLMKGVGAVPSSMYISN